MREDVHIPGAVGVKDRIIVGKRVFGVLKIEDAFRHSWVIRVHVGKGRVDIWLSAKITGLTEPAGAAAVEEYQQIIAGIGCLGVELKGGAG